MIIYSTKLWVSGDSENRNNILRTIAKWLGSKVGESIPFIYIKNIDKRYSENKDERVVGGRIVAVETDSNLFPWLYSVKYSHGDTTVAGRQWVTEIGLRQTGENEQFECSILLKTEEASTRVEGQKYPTIPNIVKQICENCKPTDNTPGINLINFNDSDKVFAIRELINNPLRTYAIILISISSDDNYLLNPYFASNYFRGTAQVICIPTNEDSYNFTYRIGKEHSAWNGGINIIYPPIKYEGEYRIFSRRILPEYFSGEEINDRKVSNELLSLILDKTNLLSSWRHISFENINDLNRKRDYEKIKSRSVNNYKDNDEIFFEEYIDSLEESKSKLMNEIEDAKAESDSYATLYDDRDQLYKSSINRIIDLEMQLSSKNNDGISNKYADNIISLMKNINSKFNPEDSLNVISNLFPDRVIVLDTAMKSAKEYQTFKYKDKLFDLLLKLITTYYMSMKDGKSDKDSGEVFGKSYAPRESETVENNSVAKKLRTFYYQSEKYEMMRHLKIGVGENIIETARVHFEWLPEEKKILIGHCGKHLDHK